MADRPIYSPKSVNIQPWVWGKRHYFYNSHREGGDYAWFADNLEKAEGSPQPHEITAAWTFAGKWNPEATLPAVLPFASFPRPRNDEYGISASGATLQWIAGRNTIEHRIYFGETNPSPFLIVQKNASYETGQLKSSTVYYWKVEEITPAGTIAGDVWKFKTDSGGTVMRKETKGL